MSSKERYVNLSINDWNIIAAEGEMLNDNHMTAFEELLNRKPNSDFCMQSCLYLQMLDLI